MQRAPLIGIMAWLIAGCGDVFDPDQHGTPLWTIQCKVNDLENATTPAHMRVAFIWSRTPGGGHVTIGDRGKMVMAGMARIAQDLSLVPQFPASFTIDLFDMPPETAMHPGEEFRQEWAGLDVAYAELVVYDDLNENGKLDMLPADAGETLDVIIGPREEYEFWLFRGDTAGVLMNDLKVEPGLNVFLPPDFLLDEQGQPEMSFEDWLEDPVLPITLVDDPDKQFLMCQDPVDYHMDLLKVIHCAQIPEGVEVDCSADGYKYTTTYTECHQDGVCGAIECTSVLDDCRISIRDPLPENWPCDVN